MLLLISLGFIRHYSILLAFICFYFVSVFSIRFYMMCVCHFLLMYITNLSVSVLLLLCEDQNTHG